MINIEKNKVILDLDEYNELRDFKQKIEAGKTYKIKYAWNASATTFISDEILEVERGRKYLNTNSDN